MSPGGRPVRRIAIALVPKLCLGTHLPAKLSFAAGMETEFPRQGHSQTEFGNEDLFGNEVT
jgi:hypothetical protein